MKLRAIVVAAALGATVLSAVPVLLTAEAAYACDYQTSCDNEQEEPEPEPADDPGPCCGGSDEGTPGPDGVISLEPVIIIGQRELIDPPPPPAPPGEGGGGGGGAPGVTPSGQPHKSYRIEKCYRNNQSNPVKATEQFTYSTSYQVSANISASASALLSASLGVQFNQGTTRTFTTEVTLAPGQTFGLYVEYETKDYNVTYSNFPFGNTTELVSVTSPTGVTIGGVC